MRPKLTIGMPTHTDAYGVYMTVQSLRLFHPEVMSDTEIIVVDQAPDNEHGKQVKNLILGWTQDKLHSAKYIKAPEPRGSAPAKERVFAEASGEVVICIDSHVFLWPGSLEKTLEYYDKNSDRKDMLCGPMIYDNLVSGSTHLSDIWSGEQYGTWAEARRCTTCSTIVDIAIEQGKLTYRCPRTMKRFTGCPGCQKTVTPKNKQSLDDSIRDSGFVRILDGEGEPFEIGAMGTGLICCRKKDWCGFPAGMYGFGAEEWIIHERWRQQTSGKVMLAPWLRWIHRFLRPDGPKYVLSRFEKVRNFVIGFRDIGWSPDSIHEHFVQSKLMDEDEWQHILAGGKEPMVRQAKPGCSTCPKIKEKEEAGRPLTLELWYERAWKTPHDINEHCPTLRELASLCDHVTEFGVRHGISTVALLVGVKGKLVSYDVVKYGEVNALEALSEGKFEFRQGSSLEVDIEPTDMLFIDTIHTDKQLSGELERHHDKVKRWMVFHDTVIYGERGEDGGPGLLPALIRFMKAHPEWSVVRHDRNNNGLMVISKNPEDKKALPGTVTMALNFTKALAKRLAIGGDATEEQHQQRLEICSLCTSRNGEKCGECGCPIAEKSSWKTEQCPLNKWHEKGV